MASTNEWHCWEITKCGRKEGCSARQHLDTPCWEIASNLGDYRSNFNICKDCIVYVSKEGESELSEEEIRQILEKKGVCVLISQCPRFVSSEDTDS